MMSLPALLLGSSLVLNVAATVPTYDIKPNCHAAVRLGGIGRTVAMCETGEANGRKELVKEWSTFTEASKDRCLKRVGRHAPSYIELLVCLQSARDHRHTSVPLR